MCAVCETRSRIAAENAAAKGTEGDCEEAVAPAPTTTTFQPRNFQEGLAEVKAKLLQKARAAQEKRAKKEKQPYVSIYISLCRVHGDDL